MKKLFIILATCISTSSFAAIGDSNWSEIQSLKSHCKATGGEVITLQAMFGTKNTPGLKRDFCSYIDHTQNIAVISLETLSKTPNIAATYALRLVIDPNKDLPLEPYSNPALNICKKLHGTEVIFSAPNGGGYFDEKNRQFDICVFGDGSSISAWTLVYTADGSRADIKKHIQATPLNIDIPDVQQ